MSFSGKNRAGANLRLPLYSVYGMDSSNAGAVVIGAKMVKRAHIIMSFSLEKMGLGLIYGFHCTL